MMHSLLTMGAVVLACAGPGGVLPGEAAWDGGEAGDPVPGRQRGSRELGQVP